MYQIKIAFYIFAIIYIGFSLLLLYSGETTFSVAVFLFALFLTVRGWQTGNTKLELHDTYLKVSDRNFPYEQIISITKVRQAKKGVLALIMNPLANAWIYNINTKENTIEVLDKFYLGVDKVISQVAKNSNIRVYTI